MASKSYKVGVKTGSCTKWVYNGLRFPTEEAAKQYGADLFSRWTAVREYEVHSSDDEPNHTQPE